jgi:hypothetical protein
MPFKQFTKSIVSPVLGVDYSTKPFGLSSRAWFTLQQLRCRLNVVSAFPGWVSMLASGNLGSGTLLLKEFVRQDGSSVLVGGGSTKLHSYSDTTRVLTDISGALSFTPTRDNPWDADIYNDILYMTCRGSGVHKWTGAGNVSAIASSPKGWFLKMFREHICTLGDDANGQRFRWAAEATETFTASATNDAGQFDLVDTPGQAMGLGLLQDVLVAYKSDNIYVISYVGGNEVFMPRRRVAYTGLLAPTAFVAFSHRHIVMGRDYFFAYEGGSSVDDSMGKAIHEKVYPNLHTKLRNRSRAILVPYSKEIIFAYPDTLATTSANQAVVYNYESNIWYGPFSITVDMFGTHSLNDPLYIDEMTNIIDTYIDLIDSYGGGANQRLVLFGDDTGVIHKIDEFIFSANGSAVTRIAETGDIFLGDGLKDHFGRDASFSLGTMFKILGVRVELLDIENTSLTLELGTRKDLNDTITWSAPKTIKSYVTQVIDVPFLQSGRWARLRFTLPSNARMELSGFQFIIVPMGVR